MAYLKVSVLLLCFLRTSFALQASFAASAFDRRDEHDGPTILLDNGTFLGTSEGDVSVFRGIPYAQPPTGDLRFRLPLANSPYSGTHNATTLPIACIQQMPNITNTTGLAPEAAQILLHPSSPPGQIPDDEDCLTLDVYAPANATQDSKLPIVYWIYGGGFQTGSTSVYNGTALVLRSLQLNEPVIFVAVNYRLSALGFAGGSEVREAGVGNIGLQDQRQGLRWVQQYITSFGGDPTKVTIWGESAGSVCVNMQMLANNGDSEGLFRGAFLQSGGPLGSKSGTIEEGQPFFDKFVMDVGCDESLGSVGVFECLRNAPVADIRSAIASSQNVWAYQGLDMAWQPWADGAFLTANAQLLVLNGSVADIPFVIGDDDDEGTIFSLVNSNITTEGELRQYLRQYYFPTANASILDNILATYPEDPTLGSPYDTGLNNSITPQFKRLASILGDWGFQGPRRLLLQNRTGTASAYSFLNKRGKETPVLGTFHGADLTIFEAGDLMDALIHFVNNLDPNGASLINWPAYTTQTPALFTFLEGNVTQDITDDIYREEGIQAILQATLAAAHEQV